MSLWLVARLSVLWHQQVLKAPREPWPLWAEKAQRTQALKAPKALTVPKARRAPTARRALRVPVVPAVLELREEAAGSPVEQTKP